MPDRSDRDCILLGFITYSPAAEDNMNVQLKDITVTARDGRVSHLDQVYIRGSHVRFFIVPDMLRWGLLAALLRRPLLVESEAKRLTKSQECAHVQIEGDEGERCWIGKRKSNRQ